MSARPAEPARAGQGRDLGRYGVLVLWAVTLAYAPRWPVVAWATQFSLGLAVLAALWTERGLALLDARCAPRAAALLDGGLLASALAATLALGAWPWQGEPAALPAIVLVISGVLFFRQASRSTYARSSMRRSGASRRRGCSPSSGISRSPRPAGYSLGYSWRSRRSRGSRSSRWSARPWCGGTHTGWRPSIPCR